MRRNLTLDELAKFLNDFSIVPKLIKMSGVLEIYRNIQEISGEAFLKSRNLRRSKELLGGRETLDYDQFIAVLGRIALRAFRADSRRKAPARRVLALLQWLDSSEYGKRQMAKSRHRVVIRFKYRSLFK